jgi:heme O synthase-like polyprenyltransferase
MRRWSRSPVLLGILAAAWIGLLVAARFGAWEAAQTVVTVLLVVLGAVTVAVFLHRWGDTQDAVVARDFERARMAKEVDKILEEEEKGQANPPPEDRAPQ